MKQFREIRDSVHDYIKLTPIEATLVDQPIFQRLRFIGQNSSAYLSYPSNSVSRFSHSLGVMHLSGEMMIKAFEKAKQEDLRAFIDICRPFLNNQFKGWKVSCDDFQESWTSVMGDNASGFRHSPLEGEPITLQNGNEELSDIFIINIIWQGVRLAGVIHDVGHLPLSHVFEYAVKGYDSAEEDGSAHPLTAELDKRTKKLQETLTALHMPDVDFIDMALHEKIGAALALDFTPETSDGIDRDICRFSFHLAGLIFLVNNNSLLNMTDNILSCLHTVISSEIDADRLDYCIRDPKSSAMELGAIDATRLLESVVLRRQENNTFEIIPTAKSMSAIESFFHQRFLIYKYLLYHHNVSRMDGVAQEIIKGLFRIAVDAKTSSEIRQILEQYGFYNPSRKEFKFMDKYKFQFYDDAWLRSLMSAVYHQGMGEISCKDDLKEEVVGKQNWELLVLTGTFLFRKTKNIFSLWKRDDQYLEMLEDVRISLIKDGKINDILLEDLQTQINIKCAKEYGLWSEFIQGLSSALKKENVLLIAKLNKAKIFTLTGGGSVDDSVSELNILLESGEVKPASEISSYLKSLINVQKVTPSFGISFVYPSIKDNEDKRKCCRGVFDEHFKKFVGSV